MYVRNNCRISLRCSLHSHTCAQRQLQFPKLVMCSRVRIKINDDPLHRQVLNFNPGSWYIAQGVAMSSTQPRLKSVSSVRILPAIALFQNEVLLGVIVLYCC